MKNPLKIYGSNIDKLISLPLLGELFLGGLIFFGLGGLGSNMGFVYFGLGLEGVAVLLFIIVTISKSIKLINEGNIAKAIIRLILIGIFALFAVYFGYNLYLALTF